MAGLLEMSLNNKYFFASCILCIIHILLVYSKKLSSQELEEGFKKMTHLLTFPWNLLSKATHFFSFFTRVLHLWICDLLLLPAYRKYIIEHFLFKVQHHFFCVTDCRGNLFLVLFHTISCGSSSWKRWHLSRAFTDLCYFDAQSLLWRCSQHRQDQFDFHSSEQSCVHLTCRPLLVCLHNAKFIGVACECAWVVQRKR